MIPAVAADSRPVCPMCDGTDVQTYNDLYLCACGHQWPQRATPDKPDDLADPISEPTSAGAPG